MRRVGGEGRRGGAKRGGCGSRQQPAPLRGGQEPGAGLATRGAPREQESGLDARHLQTTPGKQTPRRGLRAGGARASGKCSPDGLAPSAHS